MKKKSVGLTYLSAFTALSLVMSIACVIGEGNSGDEKQEGDGNQNSGGDGNNGDGQDEGVDDEDIPGLPSQGGTGTTGGPNGTSGTSSGTGDTGGTTGATDSGDSGLPPGDDGDVGDEGDVGDDGSSDASDPEGDDSGSDTSAESESGDSESSEDTGDTEDPEECNEEDNVVLYLSPDDSNSMSSPVQVRERVLNSGWKTLSGVNLRPWEFMNYYNFPYPSAVEGTLGIEAEMVALDQVGFYELQIAVSSPALTNEQRAPMNLTLALDTSGSMGGKPMEMLKASCKGISASLKEGDIVSMVEWDTQNNFLLEGHVVTGPNDPTFDAAIDALEVGGGTNLHGGLTSGYEAARNSYSTDRINRLVLISDGGANVGTTDISVIAEHAEFQGQDGIYLVGVGVGDSGYHDKLMDDVTDAGKGASVFIASSAEAYKAFQLNFVNTMAVAARDVQVELTLPPGFELTKFSGEESSTDPTEVEPQHLSPNDSMVFYQQIETCAPQIVTSETTIGVVANYKDVKTFERKRVERQYTIGELLGSNPARLHKGAAVFAYVQALQSHQRNDPDLDLNMSDAISAIDLAIQDYPEDLELVEIRNVLNALNN